MTPLFRRAASLVFGALAVFASTVSCGDVTSELITSPTGGAGSGGAGSGGVPECSASSDCTDAERRFCHPTLHKCVECTDEAQCEDAENCSDAIGECAIPCTSSAQCTDDDDRFCDTLIGFCVECLDDADCPSNRCATWQCVN